MRGRLLGVVLGVVGLGGLIVGSGTAAAASPVVSVLGAVSTPVTYSIAQLQAMTQTTETIGGNTYAGVLLETLVNAGSPIYPTPTPKNPILRVTATIATPGGANPGPVTLALGELDPSFGNNPALIALTRNGTALSAGPELVLPRDTDTTRFVNPVSQINVAVQNPLNTTPPAGGINVESGSGTVTLTAAQLAALPSVTLPVTFLSGTTPTNDTETGPTLSSVLAAAGITPDLATYVAAVGSGDYVATVAPAEAGVGNRPLQISLAETVTSTGAPTTNTPRLVTDGDVKGGRYDSNLTDLYVGEGSLAAFPTVATGAASSVADTSAVLAGTVNPNGTPTNYTFEYGPTLSFGSISAVAAAGTGSGPVAESASLTGLAAHTTYYYRLVATSDAGTSFGAVASLTTAGPEAPAPGVVTGAVTNIDIASADLNGQVNPEGFPTSYTFEYGTTTSFGTITPVVALGSGTAPVPVTATITGLAMSTTYYFRVVATSPTGTSFGAVGTFNTGPGGSGPPIVGTGDAKSITSTGAILTGTVETNGSTTQFTFQYGTSTSFGMITPIEPAGTEDRGPETAEVPVTGLSPATTYFYELVATNALGTSPYIMSNVRAFTTLAAP